MGEVFTMKRIRCPNCGGNNLSILSRGNEYFLLQCDRCQLVMKSVKELNREKVQRLQDSVYHCVRARIQIKMNYKMARDRLNILIKFEKDGKLLEIGCGTGEFLELADDFGFNVLGVDASKRYSSYAIKKGLNVKCGRLEDIGLDASQLNIIVIFHLIEHIEDPNKFLKQVFSYLKPGGLLFIVTPNVESLTNKVFGYMHPNFQQPDHLFFYSKKTLKDFLLRARFYTVLISSKEYVHHPFTSLKGFLRNFLKKSASNIVTQDNENTDCSSLPVQSAKKQVLRSFANLIVRLVPYFIGYSLYPILRPYGVFVERRIKGHELIVVARKP